VIEERFDSLFVSPHADDALLSCPGRIRAEVERGRRVLILALFEPAGRGEEAPESMRRLGVECVGAGLPSAPDRHTGSTPPTTGRGRSPEDEDVVIAAAHLLAEAASRMQAINIHAPLGLGPSIDHDLAYEAAVQAFADGEGRNLFLYEERPEAFVPGAVRTRLALLGARLPPEGAGSAPRAGLLRTLWRANEPRRLRAESDGVRSRLARLATARRQWREARVWNPLRAFGPRLQPIVIPVDEEAAALAREVAEALLPRDRRGRPRAAQRFHARAAAAARSMGAVHHAERVWLLLPSADGPAEVRHPLDRADA
jgi:LmbE family N-acetylglucosaminyl deacetylase